jgi:hypothetical protein
MRAVPARRLCRLRIFAFLADSDEAYGTCKTSYGVLTVHFQNGLVVTFTPGDFPLERIVKARK